MKEGISASCRIVLAALLMAAAAIASTATASDAGGGTVLNPLQPFERLVGGRWVLDGSYQEFEWGVGRKSVRSRSYIPAGKEPKLVSEGLWYWHPGEEEIRGVFVAVEMPAELFEYVTTFEKDRMVNDLKTYAPGGDARAYTETWEFQDDGSFQWTLYTEGAEGRKKVMGGTYRRER